MRNLNSIITQEPKKLSGKRLSQESRDKVEIRESEGQGNEGTLSSNSVGRRLVLTVGTAPRGGKHELDDADGGGDRK